MAQVNTIPNDDSLLTEMRAIAQDMVQQQRELVGEMNNILQQMQSVITQQGGDLNVLNQLMTSTLSRQQEIMTANKRDDYNNNCVNNQDEQIKNAIPAAATGAPGMNDVPPEPTTIFNAWKQSLDILSRLKTVIVGESSDDGPILLLNQIEAKLIICDYITSKEFMYLNTLLRYSNNNITDEVRVLQQHIETLGLYSCDGHRDFVLRLFLDIKNDATFITEDDTFQLLLCTIEGFVSERKVLSGTQMKMLRHYVQLFDNKLMQLIEEKLHCMNLIPGPMLYQDTPSDEIINSQSALSSQPIFRASNETIRIAVQQWLVDKEAALLQYGHISTWNTSAVTDMYQLFNGAKEFNDDISKWNVSQVTNMSYMFAIAISFNQSLSDWNVSQVTNMSLMFCGAHSFNQSLSDWNVSKVTNMDSMFYRASSFNQSLRFWNVSQVTNMDSMFQGATSFNQSLLDWNVNKVTKMSSMFKGASSFNQSLSDWNVNEVSSALDAPRAVSWYKKLFFGFRM